MRLLFTLCFVASSAVADSSSLSLALPNPPMNYQSDSFSTGNMRCSNAVGGGVNLEYGVTYARIVIPLDKPKARINCDDLYQIELTQRRLEIQKLRDELEQLKNLQSSGGEMEFEN